VLSTFVLSKRKRTFVKNLLKLYIKGKNLILKMTQWLQGNANITDNDKRFCLNHGHRKG
jgi:hypothetical protein